MVSSGVGVGVGSGVGVGAGVEGSVVAGSEAEGSAVVGSEVGVGVGVVGSDVVGVGSGGVVGSGEVVVLLDGCPVVEEELVVDGREDDELLVVRSGRDVSLVDELPGSASRACGGPCTPHPASSAAVASAATTLLVRIVMCPGTPCPCCRAVS